MDSIETIIKLTYWTIMALVAILFLLNLQHTIKVVAPENRKMKPGNVWMQLLPLVGLVYSFIVARSVSDSIVAEYRSKVQILVSEKPTYITGMVFAVFSVLITILSIYSGLSYGAVDTSVMTEEEVLAYTTRSDVFAFSIIMMIVSLAWFVLFIVYWVQTAAYKRKMKRLTDNNSNNTIFNDL